LQKNKINGIQDTQLLLTKETIVPFSANTFIFLFSPLITFSLALFGWAVIPFYNNLVLVDLNLSVLFIFVISTFGVYSLIMSGWASNSKYALLGALRSSAQLISYEIFMIITLLPIIIENNNLSLIKIVLYQETIFNFFVYFPCFFLCFFAVLAETNRVPFDLPEAESELVSGYNVEYSAVSFVFFFLAEYSNIILMSSFLICIFFGGWLHLIDSLSFLPPIFWFSFKLFIFLFIFVWIRTTLPRLRYDQLMNVCWKILMPLSISIFLVYVCFFILLGIITVY
jgi:NADH-quinone oxidoreductase subunit H